MVIIIMGVSGSGKTTIAALLAVKLACKFYDADDFHPPENIARMRQGIPLTDQDRQPWLTAIANQIGHHLHNGTNAVIACSALKHSYRTRLQLDERVHFIYLKGDYGQILNRMRQREGHFMSPDLLASQFAILEEPADAIEVDITLDPDQIIQTILAHLPDLD